jgi:D-3-phosphoglycerate dehydrogenase
MTSARDIRPRQDDFAQQHLSASPNASFHSPSSHGSALGRTIPLVNAKHLKPFATQDIKVLLLENVNQTGREILSQQGYQVEYLKSSLPEDQLIEKIRCVICGLTIECGG